MIGIRMATSDLSFRDSGMFTLFLANTPAGEVAWKEIAGHTDGTGKTLITYRDQVVMQLRQAGYTVSEISGKDVAQVDDEELLAELERGIPGSSPRY